MRWKYFLQLASIAKLGVKAENGRYTSLKLGAENFEDQILNLPLESELQDSYFKQTSNGNMFANEYHFEIQPGEVWGSVGTSVSDPETMITFKLCRKTEDGTEGEKHLTLQQTENIS